MSTTNIEERLIVVLKAEAQAHGFWSKLESETGVSAQRWRKVVSERQRPTCDMIEAAAKRWPQFALWLTTGIAYAEIGQIRPPADEYRRTPKQKPWTAQFLKLQISLHEECNVSGIDPDKIEVNSQLARKYSSSISTAKKMSAQEISAFLDDAESNWESEDVIAITNEVEEGSKLNSLPRF